MRDLGQPLIPPSVLASDLHRNLFRYLGFRVWNRVFDGTWGSLNRQQVRTHIHWTLEELRAYQYNHRKTPHA